MGAFFRLFSRWTNQNERETGGGASEGVCADSAVHPLVLYHAHGHEINLLNRVPEQDFPNYFVLRRT